jgi:hypothetical protein
LPTFGSSAIWFAYCSKYFFSAAVRIRSSSAPMKILRRRAIGLAGLIRAVISPPPATPSEDSHQRSCHQRSRPQRSSGLVPLRSIASSGGLIAATARSSRSC